ncbi:MAG: RNA methyltransferase [Bacteroidetes bacterium]|nr:RNA methyltransferase [Bacteroidota bacterium]
MISKNQISFIQSLHLKKYRDKHQLFIAEGIKTVMELVNAMPQVINELYAENDFISSNHILLKNNNIKTIEINETELKKISLQSTPNKVLAICNFFNNKPVNFNFDANFTFYLDDVRDPGNFGTIIRLANWYGINTIFCSPNSCDFYNPKVIQASMGAFLRVNCNYINLSELLQTQNVKNVYGCLLNGNNLYKQQLKPGLIIIGNEANGIHQNNLNKITCPLTIPAAVNNGTESLNAAIAASIVISEFYRQITN